MIGLKVKAYTIHNKIVIGTILEKVNLRIDKGNNVNWHYILAEDTGDVHYIGVTKIIKLLTPIDEIQKNNP
jgi:hypothetical protein